MRSISLLAVWLVVKVVYLIPVSLGALLSQNPADPVGGLAGSSGWVGVGLLGLILAWLLWVHLPAKDKQVERLVETRDKMLADLTMRYDTNNANVEKERREDFKSALSTVVGHCEREATSLRQVLEHDLNETVQAVLDLRRTLEDVRDAIRASTAHVNSREGKS